jgi:hypothetical protein
MIQGTKAFEKKQGCRIRKWQSEHVICKMGSLLSSSFYKKKITVANAYNAPNNRTCTHFLILPPIAMSLGKFLQLE